MGKVFSYCPLCGDDLVEKTIDHRARKVCASCDFVHYQNPVPAAGVILIEDGCVLLVKRKFEPRVGMWTLPAGFMEVDEDAVACAVRETKEETNLDVGVVRLFGVYSAFDDPRTAVVLVLYLVRRAGGELECGDDASEARYFDLFEHAPEMLLSMDAQEGRIRACNAAFLRALGARRDEVIGEPIQAFVAPEDREGLRESQELLRATGGVAGMPLDLLGRDGSVVPMGQIARSKRTPAAATRSMVGLVGRE